ncbi:MAG TPA: hypothetical protein VK211_12715 [Kamptonema sp.]|nr:hypothetical protein [Kamptonema sp.]
MSIQRFPLFEAMRLNQREHFLKVEKKGRKILPYKPRADFVRNLAQKCGMSYEDAYFKLFEEREQLIYVKGLIMGKRARKAE